MFKMWSSLFLDIDLLTGRNFSPSAALDRLFCEVLVDWRAGGNPNGADVKCEIGETD